MQNTKSLHNPSKKANTLAKVAAFLIILLAGFSFTGCGAAKHYPVETRVLYRDTTIIRHDTVSVPIPVERIVEVVPELDTLHLETSVAQATAYLDTTLGMLKGEIHNKPVEISKEIMTQEKTVYRDSLVVREVPVEVPVPERYVPKALIVLSTIGIITIVLLLLKLLSKMTL